MSDFNTSLLREKFVIRDTTAVDDAESVTALSNRMSVPMFDRRGAIKETFIIRAQNMHVCVRFAAKLEQIYLTSGVPMSAPEFDWKSIWNNVIGAFESKYNADCWGAVYFEGKCIFQSGQHHPFLDIIEKFDALQQDDYDRSMALAEQAFQDAGKPVKIEHDTNVALIVSINPKKARCGVILRSAGSTTTFNFTAKENRGKEIRVAACLSASAAFLEGIQLAFSTGIGKRKIFHEILEDKQDREKVLAGEDRLRKLNKAILNFDREHDVNYRPERPDLFKYLENAEKFADKLLKPQIKAKLESGEYNEKDWVS